MTKFKVTIIFFKTGLSFNRISLNIFTLYIIAEEKGIMRSNPAKILSKKPNARATMYERTENKTIIYSLFLIKLYLIGTLTESSFISVSLFKLYMLKVRKKVAKSIVDFGYASNNKKEKYNTERATIAINKELKIKKDRISTSHVDIFS